MTRWAVALTVDLIFATAFAQSGCPPLTDSSGYIGFYGSLSGCTPAYQICRTGDPIAFVTYPQNGYQFTCPPYSYLWFFGDRETSSARQPTHQYTGAGTYNVFVVVTDASGQTGTFLQGVTVQSWSPPPNPPPCPALTNQSANIGFYGSSTGCTPTSQTCNTIDFIMFSAFAENGYSFSCSPLAYSWSFCDGQTSFAPQPSHQYANGGMYNVSLTIVDGLGYLGQFSSSVAIRVPQSNPSITRVSPSAGASGGSTTVFVAG